MQAQIIKEVWDKKDSKVSIIEKEGCIKAGFAANILRFRAGISNVTQTDVIRGRSTVSANITKDKLISILSNWNFAIDDNL